MKILASMTWYGYVTEWHKAKSNQKILSIYLSLNAGVNLKFIPVIKYTLWAREHLGILYYAFIQK